MLNVNAVHVGTICSVIEIATQLLKGFLPVSLCIRGRTMRPRESIPFIAILAGLVMGAGIGYWYQLDMLSSIIEGVLGAASALGLYQATSRVPVVDKVLGNKGWIGDKGKDTPDEPVVPKEPSVPKKPDAPKKPTPDKKPDVPEEPPPMQAGKPTHGAHPR